MIVLKLLQAKELSALVLPRDTCGTYFNNNGKNVDEHLEQINLQNAGEALVNVLSKAVIVSHAFQARLVKNEEVSDKTADKERMVGKACAVIPVCTSNYEVQWFIFLFSLEIKLAGCCPISLSSGSISIPFPRHHTRK